MILKCGNCKSSDVYPTNVSKIHRFNHDQSRINCYKVLHLKCNTCGNLFSHESFESSTGRPLSEQNGAKN